MKYRKKPVVVDAIEYQREKNLSEVEQFVSDGSLQYDNASNNFGINTLEGFMVCSLGDYIIKGVNGEFYPCKANIFHKTYDLVKEENK